MFRVKGFHHSINYQNEMQFDHARSSSSPRVEKNCVFSLFAFDIRSMVDGWSWSVVTRAATRINLFVLRVVLRKQFHQIDRFLYVDLRHVLCPSKLLYLHAYALSIVRTTTRELSFLTTSCTII